jgi:hypothetical protein
VTRPVHHHQGAMSNMRKILTILALLALAGCGGGGGGSTTPASSNPAPPPPNSSLVTPSFTLVFPPPGKGSSAARKPQYVNGTSTLSVSITLVSNNGTPTTVTNPTVTTNVNGTSGTPCNPSCTVSGPPSPPGTDRYTVSTFDAINGSGNTLSTATKDFTIVAGSGNTGLSITLFGVVKSLSIGAPAAPNAGTTPADATLSVSALDAAGGTITGTYGDNSTGAGYISNLALNGTPVTVTINETNALGATLVAGGSTPGATQNSTTSVTLHNDTDTVKLHYAGLAENVKTITASATGATNGTTNFQPTLQAITPSSGTEIDLYVDSTTGGTGSSGTQTFTEAGFTGAPWNQTFSSTFTITSGYATPCNQIATISQGPGNGLFTATAPTAATPPAAGSCDLTINDNLTQAGHTSTATTKVTYTTSGIGVSGKHRKL